MCCPNQSLIFLRVETETVIHSDNDFATVAYLRIKKASLEPREPTATEPLVPLLLDDTYDGVHQDVEQDSMSKPVPPMPQCGAGGPPHHFYPQSSHKVGPWVTVTNVESTSILEDTSISLKDEVRECFEKLQGMFSPSTIRLNFLT